MKKITFLFMLLAVTVGFAQAPTDNPAAPTNDASDVVSVYSATYADVATNYDPNWGQSGHMQVDPAYDPGTGNFLLAYPNFNYQGTELTAQNLAGMEFLHVDLWTSANPGATDIQVSPINSGGVGEVLVSIAYTSGTWTSVDIPKSAFTGMTWDNVIQMKFAANGAGSTTPVDIYLDNVYFWKAPLAPGSDATLSDLQVDGETIPGFAPGSFDYVVNLQVGTTTVPQITMTTTNDPAATVTSTTQAPEIPGDATVVVTSENGSVMETYTVSFQATLPNSPPIPSTPDGEVVLSIFNDIPGYTNQYVAEGDFGLRNLVDLGPDMNEVMELPLSAVGGGYGQFNNTTVDVSAAGFLNFSYFAPEMDPGTEGHQFGIMINSGSGEIYYQLKIDNSADGIIVFNEWQNVSLPMSFFVNQGFNPATFLVWKIAAPSAAFTPLVYFDNIYFSVNEGTILSTNEFQAAIDFNVYPNPTQNVWNIKTNNQNIDSIELLDIQGRQVLTLTPNANEAVIDASNLPAGLYFAKINAPLGSKSIKLIKQ